MKSVQIQYFAILREQAKVQHEVLTVPCKTYAELYLYLKERHLFSLPLDMIQVALEEEFIELGQNIHDGARVVFIPPVAGG